MAAPFLVAWLQGPLAQPGFHAKRVGTGLPEAALSGATVNSVGAVCARTMPLYGLPSHVGGFGQIKSAKHEVKAGAKRFFLGRAAWKALRWRRPSHALFCRVLMLDPSPFPLTYLAPAS